MVRFASFRSLGLALASVAVLMCSPHDDDDGGPNRIPAVPRTDDGGDGDGGDDLSTSSSGASTGSGGDTIPTEACRFDPAITFDLPSGFGIDQLAGLSDDESGTCVEGELSFGTRDDLLRIGTAMKSSTYGDYLLRIARERR